VVGAYGTPILQLLNRACRLQCNADSPANDERRYDTRHDTIRRETSITVLYSIPMCCTVMMLRLCEDLSIIHGHAAIMEVEASCRTQIKLSRFTRYKYKELRLGAARIQIMQRYPSPESGKFRRARRVLQEGKLSYFIQTGTSNLTTRRNAARLLCSLKAHARRLSNPRRSRYESYDWFIFTYYLRKSICK